MREAVVLRWTILLTLLMVTVLVDEVLDLATVTDAEILASEGRR